ncbi:hypothetical protein F7725_023197 [Dissostichus mawsoni]|uniref:SH3 domain-containing protein n=1 Tax=Dissostichus mawsoni TaxID=36200 RepID=A0A7J5Z000_DISMA|nr:hypothetical protein F7725_023197 [Dissostichus mawsoni]
MSIPSSSSSCSRSPSSFFSMSPLHRCLPRSRKRRRLSLCSSTLNLLLYWASRGWAVAVLLGSLDTAKLAERAWVRSSMGTLERIKMSAKAKALYTFQSENKEEISIQENEELVIFDENSVDGWFQGEQPRGEGSLPSILCGSYSHSLKL